MTDLSQLGLLSPPVAGLSPQQPLPPGSPLAGLAPGQGLMPGAGGVGDPRIQLMMAQRNQLAQAGLAPPVQQPAPQAAPASRPAVPPQGGAPAGGSNVMNDSMLMQMLIAQMGRGNALNNLYQSRVGDYQSESSALKDLLSNTADRIRAYPLAPTQAERWGNVAAAFGTPTKTGNLGETMGNVGAASAQSLAAQRQAGWEKEQLASKYGLEAGQVGLQAKAMGLQGLVQQINNAASRETTLGLGVNRAAQQPIVVNAAGQPVTNQPAMDARAELAAQVYKARLAAGMESAGLTPEDAHSMAEQYVIGGDKSVFVGWGRGIQGPANMVMLRHAITDVQNSRGMTGADQAAQIAKFNAIMAEERRVGSIAGGVEFAGAELPGMLQLARQANAAVPRPIFVPYNNLLQLGEASISDPALKNLYIKTQSVMNAYDVLAQRGGTDQVKREHNRQMLMNADSPETYEVALKAIEDELRVARAAGPAAKANVAAELSGRAPPTTSTATGAEGPEQIAHDPNTGQIYVVRNGQWVPKPKQ